MSSTGKRTETSNRIAHPAQSRIDLNFFIKLLLQCLAFLLVGVGFLVGLGLAQKEGWISGSGGGSATTAQASAKDQLYICPMHPDQRKMGPGKCPICGMPLEPAVTSENDKSHEYGVEITPAARRLINIQTKTVRKSPIFYQIETVGAIQFDESQMATISSYIGGRIEKVFADYVGVEVQQGDHLAVLYSPTLYSAQIEYLQAIKTASQMSSKTLPAIQNVNLKLIESSRQRLIELGMTKEQLTDLEKSKKAKSRLTIYSPIDGTVIEKQALEGKYIKAGEPIYRVAHLELVWLMLELYPEDAAQVRFGQEVTAKVQSLPGRTFKGRIAYIDRTVDQKTRTVGVRVEMKNPKGLLRPGDYATALIQVPVGSQGDVYDEQLAGKWISPMHPQIVQEQPGTCPICGMDLVPTTRYGFSEKPIPPPKVLVVPRNAVLIAGSNSVVYVETEPGLFEISPVILGPFAKMEQYSGAVDDVAVILSGLEEGDIVATSGNFLIDSQMQLAGNPSLINPEKAIGRKRRRKGPLNIESKESKIIQLSDESGEALEDLYEAYFIIQDELARDLVPQEKSVTKLMRAGKKLIEQKAEITSDSDSLLRERVERLMHASEHLHHLSLKKAREEFKVVSANVFRLSTTFRGQNAKAEFVHFYCPHTADLQGEQDGRGDWLQRTDQIQNPYFGSSMLQCGKLVQKLPINGKVQSEKEQEEQADPETKPIQKQKIEKETQP